MKINIFSKFKRKNDEIKPKIIEPKINNISSNPDIYPFKVESRTNFDIPYNIVREKSNNKREVELGAIIATSNVKFMDETFNPYKFSLFRELDMYDEPSFYRNYENSYKQNPFTRMVIEFLMKY